MVTTRSGGTTTAAEDAGLLKLVCVMLLGASETGCMNHDIPKAFANDRITGFINNFIMLADEDIKKLKVDEMQRLELLTNVSSRHSARSAIISHTRMLAHS